MSEAEFTIAEEESHYYQSLVAVANLMTEHGSREVLMDLIEMSMQLDVVSNSIN